MANLLPRYPIYIPTKGRAESSLTARFLIRDDVPFRLVIEPQEYDAYASRFGRDRVLVLPFANLGQGSIPARNWIKHHATEEGYARHWQLDDNIKQIRRIYRGRRIPCAAGSALAIAEDFTDRYENIAITGLNYVMFYYSNNKDGLPPFYLNQRIYSCSLINNAIPHQWRGRYNEDTDICLQVLADGWCTVLINAFLIEKIQTMKIKGGNTAELYQGDGRLHMARSLERMWPGVVETDRRWQRPQHVVKDSWKRFDTPLKLKPGIDLAQLQPNEYGMSLVQVAEEVKSPRIQGLLDTWQQERRG
jgi:hypothetical protein